MAYATQRGNLGKSVNREVSALSTSDESEYTDIKLTIVSGASERVIPKKALGRIPTAQSPGSKMGLYYTAANGGSINNYGQEHVNGSTEDGQEVHITMQVTDVNKASVSVGQICEAGHTVVFRKGVCEIIAPDKRNIGFKRENWVYNMNIRVKGNNVQCKRELGSCVHYQDTQCLRYQKREWYEGNRYAALGMDEMESYPAENEEEQSYLCQLACAGFTRQGYCKI